MVGDKTAIDVSADDVISLVDSRVEHGDIDSLQTRQSIEVIEAELLRHPQVSIPVRHRFSDGMYAREITIPAGTLMTGRVHKHEHLSVMISGDMTVMTPDGMRRISGYNLMVAPPGTKRIGYAHQETVWLTVHRTEVVDPVGIEEILCEPMAAQIDAPLEAVILEA